MDISGDAIADLVLRQFDALPQKRKPLSRSDGTREWVPLVGIVAEFQDGMKCVALGTGMKCLPATKLSSCNGNILHDWHAEIVALRSLNRFLLEECLMLAQDGARNGSRAVKSDFVAFRDASEISKHDFQPFEIKSSVKFHMYCSEAPCGDASMELIMAMQDDPTPWEYPDVSTVSSQSSLLPGRAHFSALSTLRRKPSRPDAPPTNSKSCTDKLAHCQSTSLLSSITSLLIHPGNAYLSSLTLPSSQLVESACIRAFDTRLQDLRSRESSWKGGYRFQQFSLRSTSREFVFSRRGNAENEEKNPTMISSNVAAVYHAHSNVSETLIGGVLQGRKQNDPRGASMLSRKRKWALAREIAMLLGPNIYTEALKGENYAKLKSSELFAARTAIKHDVRRMALKGWVSSAEDRGWGLFDNGLS